MNIKKILSKLLNNYMFFLKLRLFYEILNEFIILSKYLGAVYTRNDRLKFEAEILIASHAIEKGLSLPNPTIGFGEKNINQLIDALEIYVKKFNDTAFIKKNIAILDAYFNFNRKAGYLNTQLFEKFCSISSERITSDDLGGFEMVYKNDILKYSQINFDLFTRSRYSVRDFSKEPVNQDIIIAALEIAKKTPSACNRQPWKVYIYKDQIKKEKILHWQMGSRGFSHLIDTAIIVTSSLKYYFTGEIHQAYVDGGLYAMSLIYAFHSLGVGTIPMTLAMTSPKVKYLYKEFSVEEGELPILLIGIGSLKDSFKVAVSERKDISNYVRYIS